MTGKQRRYLRGLGQRLTPMLHVGHEGVSEAVVQQADVQLDAHELVKVRMGDNTPDDRHTTTKQIPKRNAECVDIGTRVDLCLFLTRRELFGTGKRWCADETGLCLFRALWPFGRQHLGYAIINYLNDDCSARVRFKHDVGRLNVSMHDTTSFRRG